MKKMSYFISLISVSLLLLLSCDTPMESSEVSEVSLLEQSESNSLMKKKTRRKELYTAELTEAVLLRARDLQLP